MNFREMFPSKYLQVGDIDQTRKTVVTIAALKPIQANAAANVPTGFGAVPGQSGGQADILWAMYFRELSKPIKFKGYQAEAVFASLGEADPAKWIGRQVQIYAGQVNFGNNSFPKVLISPEPVMGLALPPAAAPPAPTPPPVFDLRGIGMKAADNFRASLAEQDTDTDGYLRWLKVADQRAWEATTGKDLSDWPYGGVDLMRRFLREFKTPPAPTLPVAPDVGDEDIPF